MSYSIKGPARKYLRREQQFQSSQISTVTQVNPSCESEQSMLEKIIFPDRNQVNNINNCDLKRNKNAVYTSRDSKLYERRKSNVLYQKELKNYGNGQYERQNRNPSFKTQRQSHPNQFHSLAQPYNIKKFSSQNYNLFPQLSSQQAFSSTTQIDEYKLQRIQQKIKSYQMKQNNKENKQNEKPQYINRSHYDTMEKELSKIQINPAPIKMKKQQSIIDNIKDEKFMTERRRQNLSKEKSFQFEPSIDRFTKNSQKCLQTIYDLVLIDKTLILSPTNITLKNSIKQEIKLVLGPIFADVTIKGKSINKKQFVEKANQILSSYRDEQIEDVFFSIVNGLSKNSEDQQKFFSGNDDTKQLARIPGRVLKNSKAGYETKQKQKSQEIEKTHHPYFSHFHQTPSNNLTTRTSIDYYHPTQRVSKKAYIQQAQRFEHGQTERKRTLTKKSPAKMSLSHQTLEMMLSEERSKRQQQAFEKMDCKGMKVSRNDDELERLNNLEKKFNEHFRSQGKL